MSKTFTARSQRTVWASAILSLAAALALLAPPLARATTVEVELGHDEFVPANVTIHAGDTVHWTWTTDHSSSVTSGLSPKPDGLFDSLVHTAPFSFSYTFQQTGHYDYFCRVDPEGMIGSINVVAASAPRPLNISTRMRVGTGEKVMIGGFIITGTVPKKVIVRAIGPSLTQSGIADVLADPVLELHGPNGSLIQTNDNWKDLQKTEVEASGVAPQNDFESAIVATLDPGNYTAVVSGKNPSGGLGLVEVYDLSQGVDSRLANISTRGPVLTDSNVMIGGFILGNGSGVTKVIVRALGPSLEQAGVTGTLADPTLELHDSSGAVVRSNDNWKDTQRAEIEATGLAPQNDLESAVVATLNPGAYTAIVVGKSGTTGVGLVELYHLP